MRLDELVAGIGSVGPSPMDRADTDVEIGGLAYDSRKVAPGTLFFCVPGYRSDGHDFAAQAVSSGAVALVVERPLGLGAPEVMVPSVRAAMGPMAARFHGDPTASLKVVGVTGTNGKTTTAYLVRALLQAAGEPAGLLGTVTSVVGGEERPVQRTTPEAIDLQADFRAMLDAGDRACAMEVSSHALELGRTGGIRFAAAVFTNLTQDHLDFHLTMEDYYLAKRRLFLPGEGEGDGDDEGDGDGNGEAASAVARPGASVVNTGDAYGRRLAREIGRAITFAVEDEADYRATDLRCDVEGCRFTLHTPADRSEIARREVMLPMPGRFNVANALGALAAVHALGADLDTLVAALERGVRVPGRFEPVQAGQEFAVLVDYAHTPDSLENVLRAARDVVPGRVICVFGAGGDRDRGKRPLMGAIASRLADVTVVTSDNPRSESPAAIVSEIMAGVPSSDVPRGECDDVPPGDPPGDDSSSSSSSSGERGPRGRAEGSAVHVEVDRRTAIERAIALAQADDVVVIAGKGHEQGQELADGVKLPFDDATVAGEALSARIAAVGIDK